LAEEGREEDRMGEGEREVEREVELYVCDCGEVFPTKIARRNHRKKTKCMV
jgi:hypothetical protein